MENAFRLRISFIDSFAIGGRQLTSDSKDASDAASIGYVGDATRGQFLLLSSHCPCTDIAQSSFAQPSIAQPFFPGCLERDHRLGRIVFTVQKARKRAQQAIGWLQD